MNGCSNKQVEDDEQEVNNEALEDYDREDYDEEASYNETDSDTDYEDDWRFLVLKCCGHNGDNFLWYLVVFKIKFVISFCLTSSMNAFYKKWFSSSSRRIL